MTEDFQSFDRSICFHLSGISKDAESTSLRNSGDDLPEGTSHEKKKKLKSSILLSNFSK